ncbi:MAG: peptidoglycan-binding protein, partial [bacterium]
TVTAGDASTQAYDVGVIVTPNSAKAITGFTISGQVGTTTINETTHTISLTVPYGTNVTALVPTISTSTGATVSPASGAAHNFTATSTYIVTAANSTTQAYTVSVVVLANTQTAPDNTGSATVNSSTPEVVVTNPTQAVAVTVSSGTTNPSIDFGALISGGTGTLPQTTITSANANNATVAIPASTVVTSADPAWDGVIAAPTVTTVSLPETSGQTKTLGAAVEVGFTGAKLSFDKAVRILLPGQAGKRAGYIRTGISFTEITATCAADDQTTGNALAVDAECKIDVGSDLVIWTKHFTSFASYSQVTTPSGGGISGGGSSSLGYVRTYPTTVASVATPTAASIAVNIKSVEGDVVLFVSDLVRGLSSGSEVRKLQELLSTDRDIYPAGIINGSFGPATEKAVVAFQKKYGLPQVGRVGPATRAKLQEVFGGAKIPVANYKIVNFTTNLVRGTKSDDVKKLQELLATDSEVYPSGIVNGTFGPLTEKAVIAFQKKYSLPQVGRVGPATRAKLQEVFTK